MPPTRITPRPRASQETTYGERFCEFYGLHRVCGRRLPCKCDKKRRRTTFTTNHAASSSFNQLMALNE